MTKTSTSLFKSPEGEAKYYAAYDNVLAHWGVPYECLRVATRFGATHVMPAGRRAPLVWSCYITWHSCQFDVPD
jgi:hypothetical protein